MALVNCLPNRSLVQKSSSSAVESYRKASVGHSGEGIRPKIKSKSESVLRNQVPVPLSSLFLAHLYGQPQLQILTINSVRNKYSSVFKKEFSIHEVCFRKVSFSSSCNSWNNLQPSLQIQLPKHFDRAKVFLPLVTG